MKKTIHILIIFTLLMVMGISGYNIVSYYQEAGKQKNILDDVRANIDNSYEMEKVSVDGKRILKKYEKLYKQNNDFIGWIKIENTNINYPVMQTKNKYDYYLKHNYQKQYSDYGTPFIGEGCSVKPASNNIVIYGHNMKNGSMFAALTKYKEQSFWEKNKYVQFDSLYEQGKYEIAYIFIAEINQKDSFGYYKYIQWDTEEQFKKFQNEIEKRQLYKTNVNPDWKDKIITLSTCENHDENSRMVIICRKLSES